MSASGSSPDRGGPMSAWRSGPTRAGPMSGSTSRLPRPALSLPRRDAGPLPAERPGREREDLCRNARRTLCRQRAARRPHLLQRRWTHGSPASPSAHTDASVSPAAAADCRPGTPRPESRAAAVRCEKPWRRLTVLRPRPGPHSSIGGCDSPAFPCPPGRFARGNALAPRRPAGALIPGGPGRVHHSIPAPAAGALIPRGPGRVGHRIPAPAADAPIPRQPAAPIVRFSDDTTADQSRATGRDTDRGTGRATAPAERAPAPSDSRRARRDHRLPDERHRRAVAGRRAAGPARDRTGGDPT